MSIAAATEVQGVCSERFSPLREELTRQFAEANEGGASVAVTVHGELWADLWVGYADSGGSRPWQHDTLVNVFSTSKAVTALCGLLLVDRGELSMDAPVSRYWPEFAQNGKKSVLVRHLFSHMAGLPGWETAIEVSTLYDWERAVALLAAQRPWWEPGAHSGYHSITQGFLIGELIRRVAGLTPGTFLREEIAAPLDADFYIGLPDLHEARVAELIPPAPSPRIKELLAADTLPARVFGNPLVSPLQPHQKAWRAAEIPASNGHGNARSVAKLMAVLACHGTLNGRRFLEPSTVAQIMNEQSYGQDVVLLQPIRWGLGFALTCPETPLSPNPRSFFWHGWGGSVTLVDLDARMSIAYAMNRMNSSLHMDDRGVRLINAAYASLHDQRGTPKTPF